MTERTYFPTAHVAQVDSYPYGRKRTTAFFGTEFSPSKGFRSTFQTVNPATGRKNAVKKSTYSKCLVLYLEAATGHYKHAGTGIHGGSEETNRSADFCAKLFDLFTLPELAYLYLQFATAYRVSQITAAQYCGADPEKLKPLYLPLIAEAIRGMKAANAGERVNLFPDLKIDAAAVEALKIPGYDPFRVKSISIIDGNGMRDATPEEIAEAYPNG